MADNRDRGNRKGDRFVILFGLSGTESWSQQAVERETDDEVTLKQGLFFCQNIEHKVTLFIIYQCIYQITTVTIA
jgi:hypothetical protein